jgi:maltooligosyltrehalose synthase
LPLAVEGARQSHVVALARRFGEDMVVAVAPRLCTDLTGSNRRLPLGARVWRDTQVWLPEEEDSGPFHDAFTGATIMPTRESDRHTLYLADVLAHLPVALLVRPWKSAPASAADP